MTLQRKQEENILQILNTQSIQRLLYIKLGSK